MRTVDPVCVWMVNSVTSSASRLVSIKVPYWIHYFSHNCHASFMKGIQSLLPQGIALDIWSGVNGRDIGGLEKELTIWKDSIKAKGLCVSLNKTKLYASTQIASQVRSCKMKMQYLLENIGSNSIFCQNFHQKVHKRY